MVEAKVAILFCLLESQERLCWLGIVERLFVRFAKKKEAMYTEIFTCTGLQHYSIFSVRDRVQSLRKWVSQETRANLEVLSEQFL